MGNLTSSEIITRLTTAQTVDNGRAANDPFKLPASLRADVDGDLAALVASDSETAPAEGQRAAASGAHIAAVAELERQLRGGYRGIAAIDEATITPAQRAGVFAAYGWTGGIVGSLNDQDRVLSLARLGVSVTAAEAGNAAWLYSAARIARIEAQLAIVAASESTASGADRQLATLQAKTALNLAAGTLLRVRFHYCAATRDADRTPELARIGYQPRRAPGQAGGQPQEEESSSSSDEPGGASSSSSSESSWEAWSSSSSGEWESSSSSEEEPGSSSSSGEPGSSSSSSAEYVEPSSSSSAEPESSSSSDWSSSSSDEG